MSTPALVTLIVIGALIVVVGTYLWTAGRRAAREDAARRAALSTQGAVLGLTLVGKDPALASALGEPPLLAPRGRELFNVMRGIRRGRPVTTFDYTWLTNSTDRPRWNVQRTSVTADFPILQCALAVAVVEPRVPLPSFLLQPNETAAFRANTARATAALGGREGSRLLDAIVEAAAHVAEAQPDRPGLRFPERPELFERYLLTGEDEARVRALFDSETLDHFVARPGWIVNAANGRLFVSVLLGQWPPTSAQQHHIPLDMVRLLPPEHIPVLVDGALDIADLLEAAVRRR